MAQITTLAADHVPSPDTFASIERSIVSSATLGAPNVTAFVDFKAFTEGMEAAVPPGRSLRAVSRHILQLQTSSSLMSLRLCSL